MFRPRAALYVVLVAALALASAEAGEEPAKAPPPAVAPCTRLAGVVVDREGKPVSGASVAIRDHRGWMLPHLKQDGGITTGADGRFAYEGLRTEEPYRLHVLAEGCAWAASEPTRPRTEDVRITLGPAKSLAGRVVDAEEKPLPDVRVELHLPEALFPPRAESGADGAFQLSPLGETGGELVAVRRVHDGRVVTRKQVVRRPGVSVKDEGLTVTLAKGLVIAGTSETVDDRWVRRIGVQAIPVARAGEKYAQGEDWCAARFAEDGSFRIEGLEKGRYRLVTWWGDANSWSGPAAAAVSGNVEVEAGKTDVVLKLFDPR
jgi:hypothetical protein